MNPSNNRVKRAAAAAVSYPFGLRTTIMELFDIGPWVAVSVLTVAASLLVAAGIYFVRSAPPKTITITSGPEGSTSFRSAQRYAKILDRNKVKAIILPSKGSVENLERLNDPNPKADLGIVQTGATAAPRPSGRPETTSELNPAFANLISLGSISYQPILIFYRGPKIEYLSALAGKRIAIGPMGSGTRNISLALLAANGVKEGDATFLDIDAEDASKLLKEKKLDAAFVMGESASGSILRGMMRETGIRLYSFKQASAYSRKFDYLNKLELPQGSIDLGLNLPAEDLTLLAPTIELIARKDLHPALVELVVEAANEIHARPGMFQKRGEFPVAIEHSIRLSEDAEVYYKSGKGFLYRTLPFWLASVLSRLVIAFVPVLVVLIPLIRTVPVFFQWIARLRIRRRYRELRLLEQDFLAEKDPERRQRLRSHFDRIEDEVNQMRVRASFADQFYGLRGHIDYVRRIVNARA
jgi:TRAP transporter TAXI family solute receptor